MGVCGVTTTLNRLKAAGACREGYAHLVQSLGGAGFDHDAPISLLTILESNGVEDTLWCLQKWGDRTGRGPGAGGIRARGRPRRWRNTSAWRPWRGRNTSA